MANLAALRAAVFSLSAKNLRVGLKSTPPAGARVKTYGIAVKLRILPPDVRSENGPFRPDTRSNFWPFTGSSRTGLSNGV